MRYTWVLAALFVACDTNDKGGDGTVDDTDTPTGITHPDTDADLDGVTAAAGDCNDLNPGIYPGAVEVCDGLDNNCDGTPDEGLDRTFYVDQDGDNYGNVNESAVSCEPIPGHVLDATDCNDAVAAIHPFADEVCDDLDVDEDCNGSADDADPGVTDAHIYYSDTDHDGYGDPTTAIQTCDALNGKVTNGYDCDDADAVINPHAQEVCDSSALDDDCDGLVDDADPESAKDDYWPDADADGYGDGSVAASTTCFDLTSSGYVRNDGDCDDVRSGVNPGQAELCNASGLDEDCDGDVDEDDSDIDTETWYVDNDGDGYGETGTTGITTCEIIPGYAVGAGDCNDGNANINAGMDELCNDLEVDEDCDGKVDEADPETPAVSYYVDNDGDAYGEDATVLSTCNTVSGRITTGGDCDDTNDQLNPAMFDECSDDIDNDCDGVEDNCTIGNVDLANADLIVNGATSYTYSGMDLAGVGDVSGDGVPDLAIGTYSYNYSTGLVSLVFGSQTGTMTTASADVDITGATTYTYFGWTIGGEGDVNGDGTGDLLVSAYSDATYSGSARLFYGPITADTTAASADATITGASTSDYLGYTAIDLIGDFNGDSYDDVVAMSHYGDRAAGYYYTGCAYIFEGPITGTMSATTADYTLGGSASYEYMSQGTARAALGDMDGDGLDDMGVASYNKTYGTVYGAGQVYVVYGGSIVTGTHDVTMAAEATVGGEFNYQYLGFGIADRVDYNGDGYTDLATSGYYASSASTYNGSTYVFYGPLSGSMSASNYDARWLGVTSGEYAGYNIAAGDINGDGNTDLAIGAIYHTGTLAYSGGAYVVLGPMEGSNVLSEAFASLDGSTSYIYSGQNVDFVQDWDGDGRDEIAVGQHQQTTGTTYNGGRTSVYTGGTLYP